MDFENCFFFLLLTPCVGTNVQVVILIKGYILLCSMAVFDVISCEIFEKCSTAREANVLNGKTCDPWVWLSMITMELIWTETGPETKHLIFAQRTSLVMLKSFKRYIYTLLFVWRTRKGRRYTNNKNIYPKKKQKPKMFSSFLLCVVDAFCTIHTSKYMYIFINASSIGCFC